VFVRADVIADFFEFSAWVLGGTECHTTNKRTGAVHVQLPLSATHHAMQT
jgi:hypothetical protein